MCWYHFTVSVCSEFSQQFIIAQALMWVRQITLCEATDGILFQPVSASRTVTL